MDRRCCADGCAYLKNLAECVEYPVLRRLTTMVETLFHVPVAYIALLGRDVEVAKRIGSGQEYWPFLYALPKPQALDAPLVLPDTAVKRPEGFDCWDLRFIATSPLRAMDGIELGALVIADRSPRPDFSEGDERALAELSGLLAARIELRTIACQALDNELSLRESERRFHAIANSAPVLMGYTDGDGACVFVNQAWLDFTGRNMSDELGDGWLDPVHGDHRERIRQAYWSAVQARRPFQEQALVRRHDGEYRWAFGQGAPRFREDGSFAGMVASISDVTEAHNASEELRKHAQCAAAIADAAGLLYFLLDRNGRIEHLCRVGQRLTRPGEAGLRGQFIWDAFSPHDSSIRWAVQRSVGSRSAVAIDVAGHRWHFSPLIAENGDVMGLAATIQMELVETLVSA